MDKPERIPEGYYYDADKMDAYIADLARRVLPFVDFSKLLEADGEERFWEIIDEQRKEYKPLIAELEQIVKEGEGLQKEDIPIQDRAE